MRHLGLSSAYAWEVSKALGISDRQGLERFATMQNHYNLLYREEEREMLPLCETEEIAVIPWSPLARGLLAGKRPALEAREGSTRQETDEITGHLYDEPSDWDVVEAVVALAKERGLPPAQIALAWLLSRPAVTAPIIGATKLSHLRRRHRGGGRGAVGGRGGAPRGSLPTAPREGARTRGAASRSAPAR